MEAELCIAVTCLKSSYLKWIAQKKSTIHVNAKLSIDMSFPGLNYKPAKYNISQNIVFHLRLVV